MPNSSIKKLGRGCGGVGAVAWVAAPAEIAVRQTAAHADLPRFAFGVELPPPPPRFLPSSREFGLLGSGRGPCAAGWTGRFVADFDLGY